MKFASVPLFFAAVVAALLIATKSVCAHGMIPHDVPVDRLIANLAQYIKDHPDDPEGYYRLGRVHTLALERKMEFVIAFEERGDIPLEPAEGSWALRENFLEKHPADATADQLKTHLTEAIHFLNKAIEMQPTEARYRLTLACALEAGESMINQVDVWPLLPIKGPLKIESYERETFQDTLNDTTAIDNLIKYVRETDRQDSARTHIMTLAYEARERAEFKDVVHKLRVTDWHDQIEEQFFTAMCYALPYNGKATEMPMWGGMEDWVSYEAGKDFIRVIEARQSRPTDVIRLHVAKETIKAFDQLPGPNGITPVVIDFAGRHLADLQSSRSTSFDLNGTHTPQQWYWLKPDVGILVWDPENAGRITSGRQLFGSVSWWLFFENGYQALDLLDDNRDGELTGPELKGLALWFDRNENGVSDSGEVVAIDQQGIASISCRATGQEGSSAVNLSGARMTDGRIVPTFDWIATPTAPQRKAQE